jgi:hypothetical protein
MKSPKSKKLTDFLLYGVQFKGRYKEEVYFHELAIRMGNLSREDTEHFEFRRWFDEACNYMEQQNRKARMKK